MLALWRTKELEKKTGNYHYGARYYDPKWSIWLSVDPLAELMPEWSSYAYTFNNPVNFTDPTGMIPNGGGGCEGDDCDPPDYPDDMPDDIKPLVDYIDMVKSLFGLLKNKSDTEEEDSWFGANFIIWGAKGTGDYYGINDEKGEKKHSIEVDGTASWLNMAEFAGKGWRMLLGLDEEVDGYPVTYNASNKKHTITILYYASNNTKRVPGAEDDNVVWKIGVSNMDEAINDTVERMKTNTPKEYRYSDTYGVDSLKIKFK